MNNYLYILPILLTATLPLEGKDDPDSWPWSVPLTQKIPGVSHATFESKSMKRTVGFNIYLPTNYKANSEKRYPAVYFLHGASGSESSDVGFAELVHRAIESGKMKPTIFVFANGGKYSGYRDWKEGYVRAETMLIRELIPHIDATYRTIADGKHRALCGYSMGAAGSVRLALKYPKLFCGAAGFAAGVEDNADAHDGDNAYAHLERQSALIKESVSLFVVSGTEDKWAKRFTPLEKHLKKHNVKYSNKILEGVDHNLGKYLEHAAVDVIQFLNERCHSK